MPVPAVTFVTDIGSIDPAGTFEKVTVSPLEVNTVTVPPSPQ